MDENLKQRAYTYILHRLANGELPPGSRLSNRALASELGISVIPVREAISQLQSEGLVAHQAGVGSFVPEPSYEELMDIYDLREAVECHAVRKAGAALSAETLDELARQVDRMAEAFDSLKAIGRGHRDPQLLEQWSSADAAFHDTIVRASGNLRALDTLRNLRKSSRVFGARVGSKSLPALLRSLEEHRQILDVLRQGNADEAARLMSQHIQYGCRVILENHHRNRLTAGRHEEPSQTPGSPKDADG